jgi:hypothetical protein
VNVVGYLLPNLRQERAEHEAGEEDGRDYGSPLGPRASHLFFFFA